MNLKLAHPGIKDLIIYSRTKACSKLVRGLFSLIRGQQSGNEDSLVGKKKRKVSSINLKKSNIKQKIKLNNKNPKADY